MTSETIRDNILDGTPFTVEMKTRQSVYRIAETLGVQAKCRKAGVNCYEVIIIGLPSSATAAAPATPAEASGAIIKVGGYLMWPPSLQEEVGALRRWRQPGDSFDDYPYLRPHLDEALIIGHRGLLYAARPSQSYHPALFIPAEDNDWREWVSLDESGSPHRDSRDRLLQMALAMLGAFTAEGYDVTSHEAYCKRMLGAENS